MHKLHHNSEIKGQILDAVANMNDLNFYQQIEYTTPEILLRTFFSQNKKRDMKAIDSARIRIKTKAPTVFRQNKLPPQIPRYNTAQKPTQVSKFSNSQLKRSQKNRSASCRPNPSPLTDRTAQLRPLAGKRALPETKRGERCRCDSPRKRRTTGRARCRWRRTGSLLPRTGGRDAE